MQESIRGIVDEAGDAPLAAGKFVRGEAGKSAGKRLAKLLAEAAGLADPDQYERHHAMRIASKRLRYTLELARPVYAADATSVADLTAIVDAVKKLQTLLGEIHDCDVWIDNFAEFARSAEGEIQLYVGSSQRFERLRPGLDYLRQERKDRRRQVFAELVTFWQELQDRAVWDRLAAILEQGVAAEKPRAKSQRKSDNSKPARSRKADSSKTPVRQ